MCSVCGKFTELYTYNTHFFVIHTEVKNSITFLALPFFLGSLPATQRRLTPIWPMSCGGRRDRCPSWQSPAVAPAPVAQLPTRGSRSWGHSSGNPQGRQPPANAAFQPGYQINQVPAQIPRYYQHSDILATPMLPHLI